MAYQANRGGQPQTKNERNIQNNTNNIKNAADVAIASGHPYAAAIGTAVKAADKLTGGKSSEALGKALNQANKRTPGGRMLQNGLNKLNESGASDKIGQAASIKNGMSGDSSGPTSSAGTKNSPTDKLDSADKATSGFGSSFGRLGGFGGKKRPSSFFDDEFDENQQEKDPMDTMFEFSGSIGIKKKLILVVPVVALLLFFFVITGSFSAGAADFEDALGASSVSGGQTGEIVFEPNSKDAANFYDRINLVKLALQANGKTVDALKIAAVYHVLNVNNNEYDYSYMTTPRIYEIANAMFSDNMYSEEVFRQNLTNDIFAKYFEDYSQSSRETLTDDVFDYIERYFSFIGEDGNTCASAGSCNYDIKGFFIPGRGNVSKPMQISNLQVRAMECGSPYGNGDYYTPIDQPLVPFEEYIAGVAYAEIGPSSPIEAIKAQMVAARSYALARPTAMGNSLGKKLEEENGQWILQLSSCVADQVFCNINEGCSYMGGGDGQGGIVRSGIIPGAVKTRDALALDHQIRTAMAATAGEVLVNDEGYIISAGYIDVDQRKFMKYANEGMNYKQILLQAYNEDNRNYGASDIQKMSCNTSGSSNCGNASTGPYASWKQYEGPWTNIPLGASSYTIRSAGCLVTSVAMLVAKSGVPTVISDFNPGTFVTFLNQNGGIESDGDFIWSSVAKAAPNFVFQNMISVEGYSQQQKLNKIVELMNQGYYVVAEVMGTTGQHWVAIDAVAGSTIVMMDPASYNTDMWAQYNWRNTSTLSYFKAG